MGLGFLSTTLSFSFTKVISFSMSVYWKKRDQSYDKIPSVIWPNTGLKIRSSVLHPFVSDREAEALKGTLSLEATEISTPFCLFLIAWLVLWVMKAIAVSWWGRIPVKAFFLL